MIVRGKEGSFSIRLKRRYGKEKINFWVFCRLKFLECGFEGERKV